MIARASDDLPLPRRPTVDLLRDHGYRSPGYLGGYADSPDTLRTADLDAANTAQPTTNARASCLRPGLRDALTLTVHGVFRTRVRRL